MLENRLFLDPRFSRNMERYLMELEMAQRDLEHIMESEHFPDLAKLRESIQALTTNK